MLGVIALIALALLSTFLFNQYRSFHKNVAVARASGIPYVKTPIFLFNTFWLLLHRPLLPYLRKLPESWTWPWLDVIDIEWGWHERYSMFSRLGTDSFLTVAPGKQGIMFWTADANVISQITTRRNDFPKPIHMYGSVDIFGKNVVSTEGQIWRHHRKVVSPPFTEKNNYLVWLESLHQAKDMIQSWVGASGDQVRTISTVGDDSMRLSLHVISRAGFGVRLLWPGLESPEDEKDQEKIAESGGVSAIGMSKGHTMTYTDALQNLLHSILWVMLLPRFLLNNLPIKRIQIARESFIEWGMYMNEMFQAKKAEIAAGKIEDDGLDLMGALVKGAGINKETLSSSPSLEKGNSISGQALTDAEILGNAFVFILAGHETAANSIHFSLIFLALNPATQRRLQADLDSIFQGKPTSEWDYERDLPKLFGGMLGAVMNEELRLVPPVVHIPKSTLPNQPQTIMLNGKKCLVPGGALINLTTVAAHRNPNFWPAGPPSHPENPIHPRSNADNDLEEFKPERWFAPDKKAGKANGTTNGSANGLAGHAMAKSAETDDLGVNIASDTSASHYQPPKGAYIPFSEGYRACIGRRFAQVEILAVLAVIFTQYSVELAVEEFASDADIEEMSAGARQGVWEKASQSTTKKMLGLESVITLQMRREVVPLRFVKRGSERFKA